MTSRDSQGALRPDEEDAGRVITAIHPGRVIARDPGGGPVPIHDFDVLFDDGRLIAVEVTRYTVEAELRQRAMVARGRRPSSLLAFDWHVSMRPRYDPGAVLAQLPELLAALEDRSVESANVREQAANGDPTVTRLASLGVRLTYRLGPAGNEGGMIDIGDAPRVGTTSPDVVVDLVEHCARRNGKASKLAAARADERHLFLWVETSKDAAVAAMSGDVLPARTPALPEPIDGVWLATGHERPRVWQYVRDDGWTDRGHVILHRDRR